VTADNPLVSPATLTNDPDQGRISTAPDNWSQTVAVSGSATLPVDVPNRISGSFAAGFRRQDEDFLPHTLNPRATNPALPEDSLDGKVRTLLGNVVATVQPLSTVGAKLRYRIYDYENQTDSIVFPQHVQNDDALQTEARESVPNDYQRQNADLDVNWDFAPSWTGTLGYGWEYWHRSSDREVEDLHEHGPNVNLDYRNMSGTLVHAGYEFRTRSGSNYDAAAPIEATFDPADVADALLTAKLFGVRKFDEADRDRHHFDLLAKVMPREDLELTFTGSVGYADYDSEFGLEETLDWSLGADAFYQICPRVALSAYYTYDQSKLWQDSRYRPVSGGVAIDDPANNWKSRTKYQYHNTGLDLTFALVPDKLDWTIGYLGNYGKERTGSSGAPGGAGAGEAVDFPNVRDLLLAATTSLSWRFADNVTLRAGYRYEDYNIKDFRDDNIPRFTDGANVYLGDIVRDYQAHVVELSAALRF
jgi:MtrB/PioB family decaheme-associated outer membrane protein